jgi:hypothetical protein
MNRWQRKSLTQKQFQTIFQHCPPLSIVCTNEPWTAQALGSTELQDDFFALSIVVIVFSSYAQ